MSSGKRIGLLALTVGLGLVLGNVNQAVVHAKQKDKGENIYKSLNVQPLTLADCARCHSTHTNWLQNSNSKHQGVACTDCHKQFHAYNPLKSNYAAIMPKCADCHDAPHGTAETVTKCANCHQNPHSPLASIPNPSGLENLCRTCHSNIAAMLTAKPSKHTKQPCSSCHSEKHGRIPTCFECHQSHSPETKMETADCLKCHPVHTPLAINFTPANTNELCAGCHSKPYDLLKASKFKHNAVACVKCHTVHRQIPSCQSCHNEPHASAIHQKFPKCGQCHSIAHDLQK